MLADAVICSPPFMETVHSAEFSEDFMEKRQQLRRARGIKGGDRVMSTEGRDYGTSIGQLGAMKEGKTLEDRDTFWGASAIIVGECFRLLRGGAYTAWVVKAFVRKGNVVDFPSDWARLLEQAGFVIVKRVHATFIKEDVSADLFSDKPIVERSKRASFFRRLYEKKYPENAIDEEVVIFARKPGTADGVQACVSSPPYSEGLGHGGQPTRGDERGYDANLDGMQDGYGSTAGQLGSMSTGQPPAAIVTSPPYASGTVHDGAGEAPGKRANGKDFGFGKSANLAAYGNSDGQLGGLKEGQPPQAAPASVPVEVWKGCYDEQWEGIITSESMAHPAKISRGLVKRIFDEFFKNGWLKKNDVVLEPFFGVGCVGIEGASRGLRVIGCELEPRFNRLAKGHDCDGRKARSKDDLCPACARTHDKGEELPLPHRFAGNFDLHKRVWELAGDPLPVMVEGDSRELGRLLGPLLAAGCVSSPPFLGAHDGAVDSNSLQEIDRRNRAMFDGYGSTPGQLARLKEGRRP